MSLNSLENQSVTVRARVSDPDGNLYVSGDFTGGNIMYKVVDHDSTPPDEEKGSGGLTPAQVIVDPPRPWDEDDIGYNFIWTAPNTFFSPAPHLIEVVATLTDGQGIVTKIKWPIKLEHAP